MLDVAIVPSPSDCPVDEDGGGPLRHEDFHPEVHPEFPPRLGTLSARQRQQGSLIGCLPHSVHDEVNEELPERASLVGVFGVNVGCNVLSVGEATHSRISA